MLKFKGSWRTYQQRILDNLDLHLSDDKLHIIAAPGAGKTTLGIEVISRLARPSVILVPTNTIKNQWKERVCSAFLDESEYSVVSTDIKNPAYITIITYQALLAAFCGNNDRDEEVNDDKDLEYYESDEDVLDKDLITSSKRFNKEKADEIINKLKKSKISLLCFDEAHHLRKEWWKALTYLVEELKPEQTLALTATPPYDADFSEWQRYEGLCGEIDEVISIPELVKNGDLCPHQDFIYFSDLTQNEKEVLKQYNDKIKQLLEKLYNDESLLNYLSQMSFLHASESSLEKLYDNPDLYISIASLLHFKGYKIPNEFLKLFGAREFEIPTFDVKRAEIFFNGFVCSNCEEFQYCDDKIEEYRNYAKHLGLIYKNKIVFSNSLKIQKQITGSLGKLESIVEITKSEASILKDDLRMVVLADYIKQKDTENMQLGVVPIWRKLKSIYNISVGVLCGSLILIPSNTIDSFHNLLQENNVDLSCVSETLYKEDEKYIQIIPKESAKHCIVSLITEMFNRGYFTVIVGTQALLGEGWDAPCINSLILSSTVSSYMLSNQMRGRAIRVDKNCPDKVSNIWHLASVILPERQNMLSELFASKTDIDVFDDNNAIWHDIMQLKKRFEGFEAPNYNSPYEISSGIKRILSLNKIALSVMNNDKNVFSKYNMHSINIASDRNKIRESWEKSLYLGYNRPNMALTTGVETEKITMRTLCYSGYKQFFIGLAMSFMMALSYIPLKLGIVSLWLFYIVLIIYIVLFISLVIKFLRTGTVAGVLKQIAIIHLEALSDADLIKTSLKNVGLSVEKDEDGIYVSCKNLPTEENNIFIKCLQEFLDPIENPRYLLIKKDKFFGLFTQTDYFSIPSVLSPNKKAVILFKHLWKKYIGECDICYTRNNEGRAMLLKARKGSFSALNRKKSNKLSKWQ